MKRIHHLTDLDDVLAEEDGLSSWDDVDAWGGLDEPADAWFELAAPVAEAAPGLQSIGADLSTQVVRPGAPADVPAPGGGRQDPSPAVVRAA